MYTGHYISDVLDSRGSGWLCLDDAHVLRTDEATVLKEIAQTAYILFYVCSGAGEGDQAPHYQEKDQEKPSLNSGRGTALRDHLE
ncbi:ubiquitin carboxyl-terminal hydrolase 37-like [Oncorhynchus kisutch]|nr:ubiquitin carboxyl-terminal hydrolase 37-like [Oncorhynchus kisutch]